MAPSRRRGAAKAAAKAAARRQWKVGDLVLAKVKGFPAWPAMVSEPEKWGYSADWKKVLVFFFGTQQIAFCNPADVEAFTEEKKQSLSVKRPGKGADYVRAVQEIIESYEKLKKQDQADEFNNVDEVTMENGGNSVDSSAMVGVKDQNEASEATLDSRLKILNSSTSRNDMNHPTEYAPAAASTDVLNDKEAALEQPTENVVLKEASILTTYSSRKRPGVPSRKSLTQGKEQSVRKPRSSSRIEPYKKFILPCSDGNKSAGDISADATRDGCLRTKRTRKSPDASEWEDVVSSTFTSNGSIEDNGSEIVTVDSDAFSLNEGSTIDSVCKLEHSDTVVECLQGNVELSKGFDFHVKAVVIKKKRKPSRKRGSNDVVEHLARMDMEADVEVGLRNSSQNSDDACENRNGGDYRDDGDEHLPLVKRARVRMGKPSSPEDKLNDFSQTEEKPSIEAIGNMFEQVSMSSNGCINSPANTDSFVMKGVVDNVSPSKCCTQISENRPQLWKLTKSQSFGCSADGEAALPPSKRLHRALEAMSANAAEEDQASVEASSSMKATINGCSFSSLKRCSNLSKVKEEDSAFGTQSADAHASGFCSNLKPRVKQESTKFSVEAKIFVQPIESSMSQIDKSGKDVCVEPVDYGDDDHSGLFCGAHTVQTPVQIQCPEPLSPKLDKREVSTGSNQRSFNHLLPQKDEGGAEITEMSDVRTENSDKELNNTEQTKMSPDPVSGAPEIAKISLGNGTDMLEYSAEGTVCENTESLKSQIVYNSNVSCSCEEVAEEVKHGQKNRSGVSEKHMSDRDLSDIQSSPSSANGVDSLAQIFLPYTSVCHMSTLGIANSVQSNDCCSPAPYSHQKKTLQVPIADERKVEPVMTRRPKSGGKVSNFAEVNDALSSFDTALGTLTRAKESIGRATRIAIECAKLGISAKVVEILAQNLESDSSLHKKVDLLFLVDSITQCSRGLKGDIGGIYPSAIQTMLPRLLSAAAPPGSIAIENRRQCIKVLRLWLERKIFPESIIRQLMREFDPASGQNLPSVYSRRSARTERALDDPIRDMEGMLVDEYGSNSSFQLPGFCMPRMLKDEDGGSDSDGESFEAVTPEHNCDTPEERVVIPEIEKHRHILEDVDGELEMEDVAPSCEVEMTSTTIVTGVNTLQSSHDQFESHHSVPFAPPLPYDVPPSSAPLPLSPPPARPPPALPAACAILDPYTNCVDPKIYNMQGDLRQSMPQKSVTPKFNPTMSSNAVNYNATECRDPPMPMPISDSASCFSSFPVRPANGVHEPDGRSYHPKAYPLRPPHRPPPNQFSYVQAGQHAKSRREAPPPSYNHRYHSVPNVDGDFYSNRERMKSAPYERRENWRFPAPTFSGPRYPYKVKESYASGSYVGPHYEPTRMPNQEWSYPRGMNHRNSWPIRPPSEGPVPVGIRAPGIWRPR
ncbi:PWWP domain-containing protein [Cephalotus follicularis]|uniref:PWWP domain-containing protein n=1 Tax=Cephalotus follicularis TaxID=3775 RepID=A0A1Q3CRP5_CEPFO|nr:PWWP domain-containing protein [Cephalotus follicularis]